VTFFWVLTPYISPKYRLSTSESSELGSSSQYDPQQRRKDFSSSLCVQTGFGAHPASRTMGTGDLFPGAEARPGNDADHSPPPSAEVENEYELYLLSTQAPLWRVVGQL
jgi:hypothetical protein